MNFFQSLLYIVLVFCVCVCVCVSGFFLMDSVLDIVKRFELLLRNARHKNNNNYYYYYYYYENEENPTVLISFERCLNLTVMCKLTSTKPFRQQTCNQSIS